MAAVRQVEQRMVVELHPQQLKKEFALTLPESFLEGEQYADRVLELWHFFQKGVNEQYQKRREAWMSPKSIRAVIFASSMENLCSDFSRRTENVKVSFRLSMNTSPKSKYKSNRSNLNHGNIGARYFLEIVRLSAIPEDIRNVGQSCVADIPTRLEGPVQADLVEYVNGNIAPTTAAAAGEEAIQHAVAEISWEPPEVATFFYDQEISVVNPPIASEVYATETDNAATVTAAAATTSHDEQQEQEPQEPTCRPCSMLALNRMRELESIRHYLTEQEYQFKKHKILDSI